MDFSVIEKLYYNNVIEHEYIYNCLWKGTCDKTSLIMFLTEKYKNNENIKDVILLVETCIFYIIKNEKNRLSANLETGLTEIIDICSNLKNNILYLKHNKQHINNKLLFSYFILKIKCL
jgi:hypothetical protein